MANNIEVNNTEQAKQIAELALSNTPAWVRGAYGSNLEKICKCINVDKVTPPVDLWFEWARLTPLNTVKVIIIGQDPYPTKGTAHGLAFSSKNTFPGSLRNIYKCLQNSELISDYKNTTTDLTSWARQGVLLLNTSLTTEIGISNAHKSLWHSYSIYRDILNHLRMTQNHIIALCWGNDAMTYVNRYGYVNSSKYSVLKWSHPSPLNGNKFILCDHFTNVNAYLCKHGRAPIKWNSIELQTPASTNKLSSKPKQIIFTDGSAASMGKNKKNKDARGGYSVLFISGPITNRALLGNLDISTEFASNIRAEGTAIIEALKKCMDIEVRSIIEIYTDSDFWIKMILVYMPKWETQGIDFATKANSDLTYILWDLWKSLQKTHKVKLIHIYAHNKSGWKDSSDPYKKFCYDNNELADKLAEEARKKLNIAEQQWITL